jgi:hypothetical protein
MAETTADDNSYVTFLPQDDPPGLKVFDEIERRQYTVFTPESVTANRVDTSRFQFPVAEALRITTKELVFRRAVGVHVRNESRSVIASVVDGESTTLGDGIYTLELETRVKTYLRVCGPARVTVETDETCIHFEEETAVTVGARSRHERPAATVTTTDNPHDVRRTLETFGSALKTTTPERSYPTLRGYPPKVELGKELDIPNSIERPETGVSLELPVELSTLFVAAPLVFYLGAEIVPSQTPRLTTDAGFEYKFDREDFEADVERVLRQVFFLDCVTRTEGLYNLDLHERTRVEPHLPIDVEDLHQKPLSEQVAEYLQIPFETIETCLPEWRLAVHMEPTGSSIPALPHIVDELGSIRTTTETALRPQDEGAGSERGFTRSERITRHVESTNTAPRSYVRPDSDSALEQAWVGDRVPVGATKLTADALENRIDRSLKDEEIEVTVVLTDAAMETEWAQVTHSYGSRDDLPFDVTAYRNVTVEELREVITEETDFLHFIGHTDRAGLHCADGRLDVSTVTRTGIDAFLLNACDSYTQGLSLVETGASGGIVTLSDVVNNAAVQIGQTIARLLNLGFSLQATLRIVQETNSVSEQYMVVGDGGVSLAQPHSDIPNILKITKQDTHYSVTYKTFNTPEAGIGSVTSPNIEKESDYYLSSGTLDTFKVTKEELEEFLALETVPIRIGGDLYWSDEVDLEKAFEV